MCVPYSDDCAQAFSSAVRSAFSNWASTAATFAVVTATLKAGAVPATSMKMSRAFFEHFQNFSVCGSGATGLPQNFHNSSIF
jgi:hypothetical protein